EFKMYNLIFSVTEMGKYKTANNIVSTIEPILEEFIISGGKLVSIMTNNSSNVKAAITQLLTKISSLKPIVNIFCAAHTLQLSVNAELDYWQKKTETVDIIQDVETYWNSIYIALKRFVKLERPIKWLANDLENSTNTDHQCDGNNIQEKILFNDEFLEIRDLVELLCPFIKATEIFSSSNYATLCIIVPIIKE
ncbi:38927_t:CDS:2, partial [Gigaspora margarita]